jgi:hypothetical protein
LRELFNSENISDIGDLATKLACDARVIGSTIKQADDSQGDIYGFLALIPFSPVETVFQAIVDRLLTKCEDSSMRKTLESLVGSGKLGWLISERIVNIPPQIASPMYRLLLQDASKVPYTHILLIIKSYRDILEEDKTPQNLEPKKSSFSKSRPSQKKGKKHISGNRDSIGEQTSMGLFYVNGEEELFVQNSSIPWTIDYQFRLMTTSHGAAPSLAENSIQLDMYRRVLIFETRYLKTLVDQLNF